MFCGEFSCRIGEAGRAYIPKKLRKEFKKSRIFITKSPDGCLLLKTEEDSINSIKRKMNKHGMILIPKSLRAGLYKNILFVGCGKTIEIWSLKNWTEEEKRVEIREFEEFVEALLYLL